MIQIEYRSDEGDDREDDDNATNHLIDNEDAIGIKLATNLVDEPRQAKPPKQCAKDDADVAHRHFDRHIRHHEGKLGKRSHEEEHDERVTERNQKRRDTIMEQRTLLVAALVHVLHRIALEAIDTEHEEHDATKDLQIELILRIIHKIHHETHAETREKSVHDVAAGGTDTCDETIPTPLVQSALDTQDANRSHRGRGNHTYDNSLEYKIKNIYLYWKCYTHNRGQRYKISGTSSNFLS